MNAKTNKYPQECKNCGAIVMPGNGNLNQEWSNYDDEMVWVVRHSDKSICELVASEKATEANRAATVTAIINYIKEYGNRAEVADGNEVIYDGRKGYNQVGWLITETDGTLYMTSRSNLDGIDMSESYVMPETDDDGYGNSNSDIVRILTGGKPADTKPFEI